MIDARTDRRELTVDEVADQLRALGVREGGVLLVHTSFRAVRPVQGGPARVDRGAAGGAGSAGHAGDAGVDGG